MSDRNRFFSSRCARLLGSTCNFFGWRLRLPLNCHLSRRFFKIGASRNLHVSGLRTLFRLFRIGDIYLFFHIRDPDVFIRFGCDKLAVELGFFQICTFKRSPSQVCTAQISLAKIGAAKGCPLEIGAAHIGAGQIAQKEFGPGEIGTFEVCSGKVRPVYGETGEITTSATVGLLQFLQIFQGGGTVRSADRTCCPDSENNDAGGYHCLHFDICFHRVVDIYHHFVIHFRNTSKKGTILHRTGNAKASI
ncbi:MAG: hypothetical protein ACD_75C00587G0002 [uncultured bacterium]|nr:MAG: hypothetical protein ACD_75C00587G0002 [uncultured bacterium]